MTDGDLVRRAMQGDAASLSELVRSWSSRILIFSLARCRNRHLAEDLTQETLLRAIRNLSTLKQPEHFGPWVRGIAMRAYLDWRKAKQSSQVPFSALDSNEAINSLLAHSLAPTIEHHDELNSLMQEVDLLNEDLRETLMLYYSHNMTYAELAAILEVSPATINLRLTKARELLRSRISKLHACPMRRSKNISSGPHEPMTRSTSTIAPVNNSNDSEPVIHPSKPAVRSQQ